MVFIIISIFILSTLVGMLYLKSGKSTVPYGLDASADAEDISAAGGEEKQKNGYDIVPPDEEDAGSYEDTDDDTAGSDGDEDDEDTDPDEEPAPSEDVTGDTFEADSIVEDAPVTGDAPAQMLPTLPKFDELLQVNPYVSGWLTIDGSPIDDPVVYTPGSQNYFLHRDIDGSNTSKGTLFIAVNWRDGFNNTLIYGHNMKDGTGFGSLAKFADSSYGMSHNVIHFDTLYEEREYRLLGVFYSQIAEEELETEEDRAEADSAIEAESVARKEAEIAESAGEGEDMPEIHVDPKELTLFDINLNMDFGDADIYRAEKDDDRGRFRYYYYTDLADRDDFEYYVRNVKERALYDTGVDAEWGDELITLSTCSYQVKNGRFILVGVRKKQ